MIVKTAEFVKSASNVQGFLSDMPEIAFAGKSNCGKSSLINMLANIKKLARTSSTPGCTALINYFIINKALYFVDLPGYGYSKAGKSRTQEFGELSEKYLQTSKNLKQLFVLLDIRNGANANDVQLLNFCNFYQIPFTVVATKADKISKSECNLKRRQLATDLAIGEQNIIISSSEKRIGKEEILQKIENVLE